ncbi:MAG: hypothetical protein JZD41_02340 [Thermoproteus sp.]|nr:hypothetical protein [Thermoproteus sp.]
MAELKNIIDTYGSSVGVMMARMTKLAAEKLNETDVRLIIGYPCNMAKPDSIVDGCVTSAKVMAEILPYIDNIFILNEKINKISNEFKEKYPGIDIDKGIKSSANLLQYLALFVKKVIGNPKINVAKINDVVGELTIDITLRFSENIADAVVTVINEINNAVKEGVPPSEIISRVVDSILKT